MGKKTHSIFNMADGGTTFNGPSVVNVTIKDSTNNQQMITSASFSGKDMAVQKGKNIT